MGILGLLGMSGPWFSPAVSPSLQPEPEKSQLAESLSLEWGLMNGIDSGICQPWGWYSI